MTKGPWVKSVGWLRAQRLPKVLITHHDSNPQKGTSQGISCLIACWLRVIKKKVNISMGPSHFFRLKVLGSGEEALVCSLSEDTL